MYTNQNQYRVNLEEGWFGFEHSFMNWIPVSTQVRSTYKYEVQTFLFRPERDFASFEGEQTFYEVRQKNAIPYTLDTNTLMSVTYEMTEKDIILQNHPYSFIELLKDVGGFLFFGTIIASGLNAILSYNKKMNWAVSELFQKKATGKWMPDGKEENLRITTMAQSAIKDVFINFCNCCKSY